jgi:hypothetical protein
LIRNTLRNRKNWRIIRRHIQTRLAARTPDLSTGGAPGLSPTLRCGCIKGCRAQGHVAANACDFTQGEWIFLLAARSLRFG